MATIKGLAKYFAIPLLTGYAWMRIKLVGSPTLLIFTYHRVLPIGHPEREREQPGMITSPESLQRHIELVKRLGAVPIHLDDWIEGKKNAPGQLPTLSVAFTFDDGWRDNYLYAYPILKKERIPATIFLVTGMIDTSETFWPERILRLLCTPGTDLSGPELQWLTPYLGERSQETSNNCFSLEEADAVIARLKSLDDATIINHLSAAEEKRDPELSESSERSILSTVELSEMNQDSVVKYGAHTQSHFRLNRLKSHDELTSQIVGCLDDLNEMPIASIPVFCYPNGDISNEGERLVSRHYDGACTTQTGWNTVNQSVFNLNRFNLHDGNSGTDRTLLATIGRGLLPIQA